MKHFVRNTAALGAVLTIVGFGMAMGAQAMGGRWDNSWYWKKPVFLGVSWGEDWDSIPADAYQGEAEGTDTVSFSDVEDVKISLGAGEVIWKTGEGDSILVTVDGREEMPNRCQIYEKNKELVIRLKGRNNRGIKAEITVPEGSRFSDVEIEVGAGTIQAAELLCGSLDVELAAGSAEFFQCEAEESTFSCAAGEIRYQGKLAGGTEANCAAGSIEFILDQKKEDFNYEIDAAGGMIEIGGVEYSGIAARETVSSGAPYSLDLSTAAGSIQVEFLGGDL